MKTIDVRTLACPGPVLKLRDLLDDGETELTFHVNDELARSNVTRFAHSRGGEVQTQAQSDGSFVLSIVVGAGAKPADLNEKELLNCEVPKTGGASGLVIQVTSAVMGSGDDELGALLLRSLVKTIDKLEQLPDTIVFYNDGVKLCCAGSDLLNDIRTLEGLGIEVLACGTCLNFFHLANELEVGRVTDMLEIGNTLAGARTVIRP